MGAINADGINAVRNNMISKVVDDGSATPAADDAVVSVRNRRKPDADGTSNGNPTGGASAGSTSTTTTGEGGTTYTTGGGSGKMSYIEQINKLFPGYVPPSKEDLEKEKKKQKIEGIFSAIGDGISALSNLYFTSKGAPNMYDASKGMSAMAKARWDKAKEERAKNDQVYLTAYLQAAKMQDEQNQLERTWKHTLERDAVADDQFEKELARKKAADAESAKLGRDTLNHTIEKDNAEQQHRAAVLAETTRKNNMDAANDKARIALGYSELGVQRDKEYTPIEIGGQTVKIHNSKLNSANISRIYNMIDKKKRAPYDGKRNAYGQEGPNDDDMLRAIGNNLDNPKVAEALKKLGTVVR